MMNQPNPILSSRDEEHMLGHGFYNKHSHEQGKANTYGLPLLVDAVKAIDFGRSVTSFGSPISVPHKVKIRSCQ